MYPYLDYGYLYSFILFLDIRKLEIYYKTNQKKLLNKYIFNKK